MVMIRIPLVASWKRGTSQARFWSRCACVQSPKISNGDKVGPSYSTMRRSVDSPNVQCDGADIERSTYQSRPWQSTAAPGTTLMRESDDFRRGGIDRVAEALHNGVDQGRIHDEGRRQQHVVAARAIDGPSHRIHHEAARHRLALDARMQRELGIEGLLAVAIGDQLEALQQAAPAHVADERMIAEALLQPAREICALRRHVREQVVAADDPLHRQTRGAGERMTRIGVAELEGA